jgi:hypothetical protein
MDHLNRIYDPRVERVDFNLSKHQEQDMRRLWMSERFGYREFQQFLADRGWEHTQDGVLKPRTDSNSRDRYSFEQILQAWLFFWPHSMHSTRE